MKKLSLLSLLVILSCQANAEVYFDPAMLNVKTLGQSIDLSQFSKVNSQMPGLYLSEIYINEKLVDTTKLQYERAADGEGMQPCLTMDMLKQYGVKTNVITSLASSNLEGCVDIQATIPHSLVEVKFGRQQVNITLPQALMSSRARKEINPDEWQEGETALFTDYSLSGSEAHYDHASDNSQIYMNARTGFNLGAWRLRNYSTYQNSRDGRSKVDAITTYVQRDIRTLRAQLTAGETYTSSNVFDSVGIKGIDLASDDNMLSDNQRGYAPIIRGIANSNAEVTVRQNGHTIYQTYVTPGAFEISDIYPSSGSGDMEISVKEQDGSIHTFTQGFAAVPILLREGRVKYDVAAGQYRSNSHGDTPFVAQATGAYGLPWGLTLYGGAQGTQDYQAYAFGLGENLGKFGAISTDVTHAITTSSNSENKEGQSFRSLYSKTFSETGTILRVTGYRYSTQGFYSLRDSLDRRHDDNEFYRTYNKRGRFELSVNQRVASYGSLFINMYDQTYWGSNSSDRTWQAGFNTNWRDISYGVSFSTSSSARYDSTNRQVALNVSLPLGRWLDPNGGSNTSASYNINHGNDHRTTQQASLFGTALDSKLNWNATQASGNDGVGNSGSVGVGYRGQSGETSMGYNYSKGANQLNYNLRGGVVAHNEGVTLSQPLGESMVLVKAPNASGTSFLNETGVSVDGRGYAVIPQASAYRENRVALDTTTLNEQVEVDNTVVNVVPTRGALVKVNFNTVKGYRTLMQLTHEGKPLPFGASVVDDASQRSSIVGEGGEVFLSGLDTEGVLKVKWTDGRDHECKVNYKLLINEENQSSVVNSVGVCK